MPAHCESIHFRSLKPVHLCHLIDFYSHICMTDVLDTSLLPCQLSECRSHLFIYLFGRFPPDLFMAPWPSFGPRTDHFTNTLQHAIYHHTPRGVPEPPQILLVVGSSTFADADEFPHPDFNEDLMLNDVQLMSLRSLHHLRHKTVEDLKLAAQAWLWSPLGLQVSTSQFALVLHTDKSLEPNWHGRKMILHFRDSWHKSFEIGKFLIPPPC